MARTGQGHVNMCVIVTDKSASVYFEKGEFWAQLRVLKKNRGKMKVKQC